VAWAGRSRDDHTGAQPHGASACTHGIIGTGMTTPGAPSWL
jgi:hypothetical protein